MIPAALDGPELADRLRTAERAARERCSREHGSSKPLRRATDIRLG